MKPEPTIRLTPGKRVLFLTKDPELIRKQLRGELDLQMKDLSVDELLDDINTDAMTPAWVCFSHKPEDIARDAYAGFIVDGKRLFEHDALINGNFEVIVSGYRKGVGSSRETATQCEVWSGIRIAVAASFAPIHAGNNINQGLLMANHEMLGRLQAGERLDIGEFCKGYDAITQLIIREGGLFPFAKAVEDGEIRVPVPNTPARPMTMGEKILARHLVGTKSGEQAYVKPGDAVVVEVDGGYTHEFTTAQVHYFLEQEYGPDYTIKNPQKFAVFEDHLIYADDVARMRPFMGQLGTTPAVDLPDSHNAGDFGAFLLGAPHARAVTPEQLEKRTDGHMDIDAVRAGAILVCPVKIAGGGVYLGDMHAMQGDGEIAGHTADVSGTVTLQVDVVKKLAIDGPVLFPVAEDLPFLARPLTDAERTRAEEIAEANNVELEETLPISVVGTGPDLNAAVQNGLARAAALLDVSVPEVMNRATITGAIEIGRAPGVVQVTFRAPAEKLDACGLGALAREQYGQPR